MTTMTLKLIVAWNHIRSCIITSQVTSYLVIKMTDGSGIRTCLFWWQTLNPLEHRLSDLLELHGVLLTSILYRHCLRFNILSSLILVCTH